MILEYHIFLLAGEELISIRVATHIQDGAADSTGRGVAINDGNTVVLLCLFTVSHNHTFVYSLEIRFAKTGNIRLQNVFQIYFL